MQTRKDRDGDILALCNPREYWSPRMKRDAISDIELDLHRYYVAVDGRQVDVDTRRKWTKRKVLANRSRRHVPQQSR
jgi:hypothetical protein